MCHITQDTQTLLYVYQIFPLEEKVQPNQEDLEGARFSEAKESRVLIVSCMLVIMRKQDHVSARDATGFGFDLF